MWHSCGRFSLDALMAKCDPGVRESFGAFRRVVESCGPVIMIPQKTRLVFMVRMRFAGMTPRKSYLRIALVLRRRLPPDPRLLRVDDYGPNSLLHSFRIDRPEQFDARMRRWIREAYKRGTQARLLR
jgi:Domain of unknown function (DUF5655)